MASDCVNELLQYNNDSSVNIKIGENFGNFLYVLNDKLRGILLPSESEINVKLDRFINDLKLLNNNNVDDQTNNGSLMCIPDSTLPHNNSDFDKTSTNNELCSKCKRIVKSLSPNMNHKSRELTNLINHGFSENHVKMKNVSSRRSRMEASQSQMKTQISKEISKKSDSSPLPELNCNDTIISPRVTQSRLLKTMANEKIIDLCTRKRVKSKVEDSNVRRSLKESSVKLKASMSSEIEGPRVSDVSVYDFVDDDDLPSLEDNKRKAESKQRKRKKSPITEASSNKMGNSDSLANGELKCLEYKGNVFTINDIVWAKIPGYPFWPAHIRSFDTINYSKSSNRRCRINWIGWDQKSYLPVKSLLHFKENFQSKYSAKLKSQKYKTAIELACKELGLEFSEMTIGGAGSSSVKRSMSSDKSNSSDAPVFSKKKRIDLDDIFNARAEGQIVSDMKAPDANYSDDDTDEEEKARSALVTAESLETRKILSGFVSNKDE